MTVMSEGLLLNSKYIKMGREKGGFQALFTQPPLVIAQVFIHTRLLCVNTISGSQRKISNVLCFLNYSLQR